MNRPFARSTLVAILLLVTMLAPVHADSGDLDRSFAGDGKVTVDFGQDHRNWSDFGFTALRPPDGRLLLYGYTGPEGRPDGLAMARLRPNGRLDATFGVDGRAASDPTACHDEAVDAALAPDGGVVLLARMSGGPCEEQRYLLVRHRPDGSRDRSFGTDGLRTGVFGPGRLQHPAALVVQAGGRIIVAGRDSDDQYGGVLIAYTKNGRRDVTFGDAGRRMCDCHIGAMDLASDGRIVVAGLAESASGAPKLVVLRFRASGRPDPSFGEGGRIVVDVSQEIEPTSVLVTPSGAVVVAGTRWGSGGADFAIVRVRPEGRLTDRFGRGGVRFTDFEEIDLASAVARLPDGRLVVVGTARCGIFCAEDPDAFQDFALAMYTRHGRLDRDFGGDGKVITKWNAGNGFSRAFSVVAQPDGRIVAFGGSGANNGDFAAARYLTTGP